MFEEKIIWHEITERPVTEEEKADFVERGYADYELPAYILDCEMPEDGQVVLIATKWGVDTDVCATDGDFTGLEGRGDWDGVKAWAAMPKYKEEQDVQAD